MYGDSRIFHAGISRLKILLKNQYFWYAAVTTVLASIFAFAPQLTALLPAPLHTEPQTAYYVAGYRVLFPLAVLLSAWRFRVRGGLIVCVLVGPVIIASFIINSKFPNAFIDLADIGIGIILSVLVGKQGETKQRLEETTAELKAQSAKLKREIIERKRVEEQYKLVTDNTADIIYKLNMKEE